MAIKRLVLRLVALAFILTAAVTGWCQRKPETGKKEICPMRAGSIEKYEDRVGGGGHHNIGTIILGTDSLVYATKSGSVESIFEVGDVMVIMIRSGKLFYTYGSLDNVFVTKGAWIARGKPIGICNSKNLDFVVSDINGKLYPPENFLDCKVVVVTR